MARTGTAGQGGRDEPAGPVLFSRLATLPPLGDRCRVCGDGPCRMQRQANSGVFAERPGCCQGSGATPLGCTLLPACVLPGPPGAGPVVGGGGP